MGAGRRPVPARHAAAAAAGRLLLALTVLAGSAACTAGPAGTPTTDGTSGTPSTAPSRTGVTSSTAPTSTGATGSTVTTRTTTRSTTNATTRATTSATTTRPATSAAPTTRSATGPAPAPVPPGLAGRDWTAIPTTRRVVALTFDAGASDAGVASVVATLRREDVPATFFLTGAFARRYPAAARAMTQVPGSRLGNHSDTHPEFPSLTDAAERAQLRAAEASIVAATGRPGRPFFRFPMGATTPADVRVVNAVGYVCVRWTVDTLGWKGTSGGQNRATVVQRVLAAARPGEIVLMHVGANPDDASTLDADALPQVISGLRAAGYGFTTLDALGG